MFVENYCGTYFNLSLRCCCLLRFVCFPMFSSSVYALVCCMFGLPVISLCVVCSVLLYCLLYGPICGAFCVGVACV